MRAIKPDEVKTLIRATRPMAMRDRGLLDLLYHTGLRISEALELRASDIEGERIIVRRGKGGKRRIVELASTYGHWELWLDQRKAKDEEYIFTTRNGARLATSHVRRLLANLARKTGIETHPHGFRHAHACQVYEQTKDIAVVSRQLGHARLSTTSIYLQGLGIDAGQVAALSF